MGMIKFAISIFALLSLSTYVENAAAFNRYKNWDVSLGASLGFEPLYSGSDYITYRISPYIVASYETSFGALHFEEKKGWYTFVKNPYMEVSTGMEFGQSRRKSSLLEFGGYVDMDFLKGTPTLDNPFRYFGEIAFQLPFGKISTTAYYAPITANYEGTTGEVMPKKTFDGFLLSASWKNLTQVSRRLNVEYGGGTNYINQNYGRAYYGIQYSTSNFPQYDVVGGLEDIFADLSITYMFNSKSGANFTGKGRLLLGGARGSPLTKNTGQLTTNLSLFYNF